VSAITSRYRYHGDSHRNKKDKKRYIKLFKLHFAGGEVVVSALLYFRPLVPLVGDFLRQFMHGTMAEHKEENKIKP
jgi:hypothetical protein